MRNILAIANKELKSYFASPIGYIAVMLLVSLIHIGVLFLYGRPEVKPLLTAYLGLFLVGGCFISVGLFISTLTRNQIVAYMSTFAVFLLLWVINWIGTFASPTVAD